MKNAIAAMAETILKNKTEIKELFEVIVTPIYKASEFDRYNALISENAKLEMQINASMNAQNNNRKTE